MEKYLVIIEKAGKNYSAYSPDIDGCIATGKTVEKTVALMKETLQFHIEGMLGNSEIVPKAKGLDYHIQHGILEDNQDEYFICELKIPSLQYA